MRFGVLKSVGHNLADSLSSGMGFPIGVYFTDIYAEAAAAADGVLTVDFLTGQIKGGAVSKGLAKAVRLYSQALEGLCLRHGIAASDFSVLTVQYGSDLAGRPTFCVSIKDWRGRSSSDRYEGWPGKRAKEQVWPLTIGASSTIEDKGSSGRTTGKIVLLVLATVAAIQIFTAVYPGSHLSLRFLAYLVGIAVVGIVATVRVARPAAPPQCGVCGEAFPRWRSPMSFHQALRGGRKCRHCGADV